LIEALGFQMIASVEAAPVAVVVTTVAQEAVEIEDVPSAEVPLAIVVVQVAQAATPLENVIGDVALLSICQ
jgi:hypothetical protein